MDDRGVPHGLHARRADLSIHCSLPSPSLPSSVFLNRLLSFWLTNRALRVLFKTLLDTYAKVWRMSSRAAPWSRPSADGAPRGALPRSGHEWRSARSHPYPRPSRLIFEDCLLMELVTIGNKHEGIMRVPVSCSRNDAGGRDIW